MNVVWRKSAIQSLLDLDSWRASIELPGIASFLRVSIEAYFKKQEYTVYIPGRQVFINYYPVDLRMTLISVGKSDPYKVFFRITSTNIELFLVRHPHQRAI